MNANPPAPPPGVVMRIELPAARARQGHRRLSHFQRNKHFLSERLIFRDPNTGALLWRLTCDPAVDKNAYYDLPAYNADGSLLMFLTGRGERPETWLMNADGTHLRPVPAPPGSRVQSGYWSNRDPTCLFYAETQGEETRVIALNVLTGQQSAVASVRATGLSLMPPHPSDEWFLLGANPKEGGDCVVFVLGRDGRVQQVPIGGRYHRLRFSKAADCTLFFNRDDPRTQWIIRPDGTGRKELPDPGVHPDWLPDGSRLTYFAGGNVYALNPVTLQKTLLLELGGGGHGGPTLDGRMFAADTTGRGPLGGSVILFRTDGSQVAHRLCPHRNRFLPHNDASRIGHPDHHSTHAHPIASPDYTKVIFSSTMLGGFTDVFAVIARLPDPPRRVQADAVGNGVRLRWEPGLRHRETAHYRIYQSASCDGTYAPIAEVPANQQEFVHPGEQGGFYRLTAVEHSGLESLPSAVVCAGTWRGHVCLWAEAEEGEMRLPAHEVFLPNEASGFYAVGSPKGTGGSVVLPLHVPRPGNYRLWLRVRGVGRLSGSAGEHALPPIDLSTQEWQWFSWAQTWPLPAGRLALGITWQEGDVRLDQVALSDDSTWKPQGILVMRRDPPKAPKDVKAEALDPFTVRLTWQAPEREKKCAYHVYALPNAEAPISEVHRIGSPAETEWVDWGLPPGGTQYYRVTTLRPDGTESPPSPLVTVKTPPLPARVHQSLSVAQAEREGAVRLSRQAGRESVSVAAEAKGAITFTLEVPVAGEYVLWGLGWLESDLATFRVSLDGEGAFPWRLYGPLARWTWSAIGPRRQGSPSIFHLSAGRHTLRIDLPPHPQRLAEVVITNNLSWVPQPSLPFGHPEAEE